MAKSIKLLSFLFILTAQLNVVGSIISADGSGRELTELWFDSAKNGDLETLKSVIGHIDINIKDDCGWTALMAAAHNGHESVVKYLSSVAGIDLNVKDKGGWTILMALAPYQGVYKNILKHLLQIPKIDINIQNNNGITALMLAIFNNSQDIVTLLMQVHGIDVNVQAASGNTALTYACAVGNKYIVRLLLRHPGIVLNTQNKMGKTALINAAEKEYEAIVRLLLACPTCDINMQDCSGSTALIYAAYHGNENIVKLLLAAPKININLKDKHGNNALMWAKRNQYDSIEILIKNKIYELLATGHEAIKKLDLDSLKKVIAQIGDGAVDHEGNTLLHMAFADNSVKIISYLLQNSPDARELLSILNNHGQLALEFVSPSSEIFEYFVDLAFTPRQSGLLSKRKWFDGQADRICAYCLQPNCIERCSRCRKVYYCSQECQKADWKDHKTHCASRA